MNTTSNNSAEIDGTAGQATGAQHGRRDGGAVRLAGLVEAEATRNVNWFPVPGTGKMDLRAIKALSTELAAGVEAEA